MKKISLICGKSEEILPKFRDNYIDVLISDIPYGVGINPKWDNNLPSAEIWEECYRILKPGSHCLIFGQPSMAMDLMKVMIKTKFDGEPYYLYTAKVVRDSKADGCVIGLTCFVNDRYIRHILKVLGDKVVLLLQGIGPQGGQVNKLKYAVNPLISLGRAVIYSDDPRKAVKRYHNTFKKYIRI